MCYRMGNFFSSDFRYISKYWKSDQMKLWLGKYVSYTVKLRLLTVFNSTSDKTMKLYYSRYGIFGIRVLK